MDTLTAIATRHSIRRYNEKPVTDEEMQAILYAGFSAPTAHNRKPIDFLVIKDREKLSALAEGYRYASMLRYAAACIIVCGDTKNETKPEFIYADCSAATQNILLATHSIGLGAVWCGVLKESEWYVQMKESFGIPKSMQPISLIAIGHTDNHKMENRTERWNEVKIHHEKW